jgi:phage shock protein C
MSDYRIPDPPEKKNKLYRSRRDRKLFGVCGGLAEYFGIDSTLIRLGLVLLVVLGGSGLLAYFIAAIIIQDEPGW